MAKASRGHGPTRSHHAHPGHLPAGHEAALARSEQRIRGSLATVESGQARAMLSPRWGSRSRSLVKNLRDAGDLIGLPIGQRPDYLYPVFQFDAGQCRVRPVVAHANRLIMAKDDPYGSAAWWITPTDLLDGMSPLDALEARELTEPLVDNVISFSQQGM